MNETFYDDGTIKVTPTEIRTKGVVLDAENVSTITVNTMRPTKWMVLFSACPSLMLLGSALLVHRMIGTVPDHQSSVLIILLCAVALGGVTVLAFLLRVSRLFLQTPRGPVLLAAKLSLTASSATLARYQEIKAAIERAASLRKKRTLQPA